MALELDDQAADLFCSIIASNVDEAARISNLLIDGEAKQKRYFAKALVDLYESIERIPDYVRSAYLDGCLFRAGVAVDAALRVVNEPEPS